MKSQPESITAALELRSLYPIHASRALALAVALHFIVLAGIRVVSSLEKGDADIRVIQIHNGTFLQPPSLKRTETIPSVKISAPSSLEAKAAPVMVPDAEISADQTIATQDNMNTDLVLPKQENDDGTAFAFDHPPITDSEAEPPPFTPYQKEPQAVVNVTPQYPEIALKAGIEGNVYIRVWITIEGKVKKAEVVSSTSNILDQAALDAARQWVFTPAIMNDKPVAVWMSIPFKFRIRDRR